MTLSRAPQAGRRVIPLSTPLLFLFFAPGNRWRDVFGSVAADSVSSSSTLQLLSLNDCAAAVRVYFKHPHCCSPY